MKYLFRLLLLIACVVAIFAGIGSLLPRSYDFTVTQTIEAPPSKVFPLVNNLSNWPQWSRQFNPDEIDGLSIQYNGIPEGKGAAQTWTDIRGEGKLWITKSEPDQLVAFDLKFTTFPVMSSEMVLEGNDGVTVITWQSKGSLPGGPFYGFFGNFFSTHMRDQYQKSLERLKSITEND